MRLELFACAAILVLGGLARAEDCATGFAKLAQSPEMYQGKYRIEFACMTPIIKCPAGDIQANASMPAPSTFQFSYRCAKPKIAVRRPCAAGFEEQLSPVRPSLPAGQLVCTVRAAKCPAGTIARPWQPFLLLDLPQQLEAMYFCMKMD